MAVAIGVALILLVLLATALVVWVIVRKLKKAVLPRTNLPRQPPSTFAKVDLTGNDGFWFDIVGESNYQGTLRRIAGQRLMNEEEVLVTCLVAPEPTNPNDENAVAVFVDGYGKVGYFSRGDCEADGWMRPLRDSLFSARAVGVCPARLIGGWDETVSIGVRLAILRPSQIRGYSPKREPQKVQLATQDWRSAPRIELAPGKGHLNLVDERLCQEWLHALVGDRDVDTETIAFDAALVVEAPDRVVVCSDGGEPVGRLGRGDCERYAEVLAHLMTVGAIGRCGGWVIREREGLGARLSLLTPKKLAHALGVQPNA